MKHSIALFALLLFSFNLHAQYYDDSVISCDEFQEIVEDQDPYPMTYYSYDSESIDHVDFHEFTINYKTYYFAIVTFKPNPYQDYIFAVESHTEFNYSLHYLNSAGQAYHNYIRPYSGTINCQ